MILSIILIGLLAIIADVMCFLTLPRMFQYIGFRWSEGNQSHKFCWMVLTVVVILLLVGPVAEYTNHLSGFVRRWMITTEDYNCAVTYLVRRCISYTAYGLAIAVTSFSMMLWLLIFRHLRVPASVRLLRALTIAIACLVLNITVLVLYPGEDYYKEAYDQYLQESQK